MPNSSISNQHYARFSEFLQRSCGIVLGDGKQYLVKSRLQKLVADFACANLEELIDKATLGRDAKLTGAIVDAMTTNETSWFRDGYPFQLLTSHIFPQFSHLRRPLRIWSAACSSGQEAYSIAMTFAEYQAQNRMHLTGGIEILATDLSDTVLQMGRAAEYDQLAINRGLSEARKQRFFQPGSAGKMRLIPEIRRCVRFEACNLMTDIGKLSTFDIVFCRNVLIYFAQEAKKDILQQIAAKLQEQGVLFVGASENVSGMVDVFQLNRHGSGLYYSKKQ